MASSIDHTSSGRAVINLVSGWWQQESEARGLPTIAHDERYQRSEEFLTIVKGLWSQHHFSFDGQFNQIRDGSLSPLPVHQPHPTIYLGGASAPAQQLAAKLTDVYLMRYSVHDAHEPRDWSKRDQEVFFNPAVLPRKWDFEPLKSQL